ncbi:two-component system response regulator [Flocculibacter collagenilyticus]|uniref:two-component system response regulator n=1 Tax=Flocculibacter collagenilyticus TaxID=2744479 RepID=UPI0018F74E3D|nr:diguanylate cyclase [Flocculibacter collagenilyticus]
MNINLLAISTAADGVHEMQSILSDVDANLVYANSVNNGVEVLVNDEIHAVIISYSAPDDQGKKVAKALCESVENCPPFLFITESGTCIEELEKACNEFGAVDFIEKPFQAVLLSAKLKVLTTLAEQKEQLRALATTDSLTKIKNRLAFQDSLVYNMALATRQKRKLALLALDLDEFKKVNDSLGHAAGDELLCTFAKKIQKSIRGSDIAARVGGDEFVVLLTNIRTEEDAEHVANKILKECEKPFCYNDVSLTIKTSIGIALFPNHAETPEEFSKVADDALYKAKSNGRDQIVTYVEGELEKPSIKELHEIIVPYIQPILYKDQSQYIGCEVFVRFKENEYFVKTDTALAHFRKIGKPRLFENILFEKVLLELDRLAVKFDGTNNFKLFFKISIQDLLDNQLVEDIINVHNSLKSRNMQLVIDFDDWQLLTAKPIFMDSFNLLSDQGIKVCLGNVGELYIPNGLLAMVDISLIKISYHLCSMVTTNHYARAIIQNLVQLAQALDCKAVAAGVSNSAELVELKKLGCNYFQGKLWEHDISGESWNQIIDKANMVHRT